MSCYEMILEEQLTVGLIWAGISSVDRMPSGSGEPECGAEG